ncbi:MAG: IPTL-CTERM sorting domain-containing protein, partial [Xanthomonadales bacterium]|nr:IPTL-CTERM sorting domain-containing protein [Xanthomonadales bacterium]
TAGNFVFASGVSVSGNLAGGGNGTLDYTAVGAAVVNLSGAGSTGVGGTTAGMATVTTNGSLGLSGVASGALTATSNGGAITQAGALTVTGNATLDAGTGAIGLSNTNNDFMAAVSATGAGVSMTDANAMHIASLTDNANGDVSLVAQGALLSTGAINAGTGNITLQANSGTLSPGSLSGANIDMTGHNGIVLSNSVMAAGNLSLTSANAAIQQSAGSVMVTGPTTVDAGSGAITLNGAANSFQGKLSLLGGSASVASSSAMQTGAVSVTGNLALTAPSVTNAVADSTTFGSGSTTGQINGAYVQGGDLNLHAAAASSDQLAVSGSATLGGNLSLAFSAVPAAGQSFTVLNASAISGTFASVNATGLPAGLGTSVAYNLTSVVLTVQGAAQTLSIAAPTSVLLGSGTTTVSATASSGLAVTLTSTTPTVCTVTGAASPFQIDILGVGSCHLTAAQAGDATHAAVSQVVVIAVTLPVYVPVPTLNAWMLLLLAVLLGGGVVVRARRCG